MCVCLKLSLMLIGAPYPLAARLPSHAEPAWGMPRRQHARLGHLMTCSQACSRRQDPTALPSSESTSRSVYHEPMPPRLALQISATPSGISVVADGADSTNLHRRLTAEISLTRPFFPARPGPKGSQRRADLPAALGIESYDALRRHCDLGYPGRSAAAALFWTLGGNQVGKAAICGWRDVIAPALRATKRPHVPVSLWPFDGPLAQLLDQPGMVVAETYPGEIYGHFAMDISASHRSKRRQADRHSEASALIRIAKRIQIELADSLSAMITSGFGSDGRGEDRFDAVVGLFGMINVLRGNRPPGDPSDVTRCAIEGWILGQGDPPNAR